MTTSRADFLQLRLQVDRDAAAVVRDGDRAVGVDDDLDVIAVAGQRFVDGVVDELVDHVVQAVHVGVADVHARPLADGLEPLEDLDVGAGVVAPVVAKSSPLASDCSSSGSSNVS